MSVEKPCYKCGVIKPLSCFHKRSSMLDGHFNECKECRKLVSKEYYNSNKEKIDEKNKLYASENKEKKAEMDKKYYELNSVKLLEQNKEYRLKNKSKIKEQRRGYYIENVDKISEYKKGYYSSPEGKASRNKANRKRKAMKKSQLHPSHNPKIEKQLELMRQRIESCLGIKHDLDHVWPLSQGGLHHIENLRIVPSSLNQRKHNNMEFEHPSITMWYELPPWLIEDTLNWNP